MSVDKFDRRIKLCEVIISVALPLTIGLAGYFIQLSIAGNNAHHSMLQAVSVKLSDRRLLVYDEIKNPLNDIYCYIEEVGDWDQQSATTVRQLRHSVNNIMYVNRAIWSPETFDLYIHYMDKTAFRIGREDGYSLVRARISPQRIKNESESSLKQWLTGEAAADHRDVFRRLNESITHDLLLRDMSGEK